MDEAFHITHSAYLHPSYRRTQSTSRSPQRTMRTQRRSSSPRPKSGPKSSHRRPILRRVIVGRILQISIVQNFLLDTCFYSLVSGCAIFFRDIISNIVSIRDYRCNSGTARPHKRIENNISLKCVKLN